LDRPGFYLGFSFGYHDSTVSVITKDQIVGVYAEERFSRVKHDKSFPAQALNYALKTHGINKENIVCACFYEIPLLRLFRINEQFQDSEEFAKYLIRNDFQNPLRKIANSLDITLEKVVCIEHHLSHAFNAFLLSEEFNEKAVFTIDGVGEYDSSCIYEIKSQRELKKKTFSSFPSSLGIFYSAITSYLGFEVNDAEFKVMGLAAYGEASYIDKLRKVVSFNKKDSKIYFDQSYFLLTSKTKVPYSDKFIDEFGLAAPSSKSYAERFTSKSDVRSSEELRRYADIACSAQLLLEEILVEIFSQIVGENMSDQPIYYSGGVALNTKANQKLLTKYPNILIPPDPGDGGSSLGCAYAALYNSTNIKIELKEPYLGYDIANDTILEGDIGLEVEYLDYRSIVNSAANDLASNKVIGWAHGRAEMGPRALGNRSILANPQSKDAQLHVNTAIKFREPFRPFAPAILEPYISDLYETYDIDTSKKNGIPRFMLSTLKAKETAYNIVPACIHIDGTSRVQAVDQNSNELFFDLLKKFHDLTGIPALLNTSFNLRGEPIVNNLDDAIDTFRRSGLDVLYVGSMRITKRVKRISVSIVEEKKNCVDINDYSIERKCFLEHYCLILGGDEYYSQLSPVLNVKMSNPELLNIKVKALNIPNFDYKYSDQMLSIDRHDGYTHELIVDVFGRIASLRTNKGGIKLLNALYKPKLNDEQLQGICSISPMNRMSINHSMLHTDAWGFRLRKKANDYLTNNVVPIEPSQNERKYMVLGGSFAASVYAPPESAFSDILEELLNEKNSRKATVYNFAMSALKQEENFTHLLYSGAFRHINTVIWVDGLNDFMCGVPTNLYYDFEFPFNFAQGVPTMRPKEKQAQFVEQFTKKLGEGMSTYEAIESRVNAFLAFRRNAIDILQGLGIQVVNILQPINDWKSGSITKRSKDTIPFYSNHWHSYRDYSHSIPEVARLGRQKYGVEFYFFNSKTNDELEFWDSAHLSPEGEKTFAKLLYELLQQKSLV